MKHILKSNGGFSLSRVVKLQNLDEISLDMTIYEVYCILYSNARLYFERVNILFHMKSHLSPHQSTFGSLPKRGPWSVNSINLAQRSTSVLKLRHADNKFSIVHLFTRWLAGWLAGSLIHSFIYSLAHSFVYAVGFAPSD